jgi:hypothetical protein
MSLRRADAQSIGDDPIAPRRALATLIGSYRAFVDTKLDALRRWQVQFRCFCLFRRRRRRSVVD